MLFATLGVALLPALALAKNDAAKGGLAFLGVNEKQTRSVWLSGTLDSGSFELQAPGKQTVDQWTRTQRGLRVSLSPDVSNGNGGPHELLDVTDGKSTSIAKVNQKGGIIFSWDLVHRLPPLPPGVLPPPPPTGPDLPGIMPGLPTIPGGNRPAKPITPELPSVSKPTKPGGVTPPIGTLPPTSNRPDLPGITPGLPSVPDVERPAKPITPELPGGVAPPIGTLPPTSNRPDLPGVTPGLPSVPDVERPAKPITPELPGGVTPPIGTLPPTSGRPELPGVTPGLPSVPDVERPAKPITPELPGGVAPPIGTLPPTSGRPELPGVTPGLPTVPDVERPAKPITPELPGGVAPPIETLPPTSGRPELPGVTPGLPTVPDVERPAKPITPMLPGGVAPPIGTLPPTSNRPDLPGVTPGLPSVPDVERPAKPITPELPGGVTPPIGTLPPTSGKPELPGVTPGLPTVPDVERPAKPITPELPGGVTPPIGTLPPVTGVTPEVPGGVTPPIGTLPPEPLTPERPGVGTPPVVRPVPLLVNQQLPREDMPKGWNVWSDLRFTTTNDTRYGFDLEGSGRVLTFGADDTVSDNLILGASFSLEESKMDAFGRSWQVNSDGLSVGPYLNYRLSTHWSLDASVGFNQSNTDSRIAVLRGSYAARRYFGAVSVSGLYLMGKTLMRPSLGVYYSHTRNEDYAMRGTVEGEAVALTAGEESFESTSMSAGWEVSHYFRTDNGTMVVPYAELSAQYQFNQPEDGLILTSELTLAPSSPWTETIRAGVRFLFRPATSLELSTGYLGFGHPAMNIWEQRIFVSHAF